MFSILVANYNNGKFFLDFYNSIINQTYQDFEVIIVDDVSTDNSIEVIKDTTKNDKRFKLYINQENKGCGYTKRRCAELATGEISGFVDPDDAITDDALEIMVNEYEKNPEVTGVYSQFFECYSDLKPKSVYRKNSQVRKDNKAFFNTHNRISHFFTFKTSAYKNTVGINSEYHAAIDQDLYLKIYEQGLLKFVEKPLYYYRKHEGGISQNNRAQKAAKYFSLVINDSIKRRKLTKLNGKNISEINNILDFLQYQDKLTYRIKEKLLYWIFKLLNNA